MNKERLVFGQLPPQEQTFRHRSQAARREKVDNQEVFGVYRFVPIVEKALEADWESWHDQSAQRKQRQEEVLKSIFGNEVAVPGYISPSTASLCLRWVGYEALGHPAARPTTEANLAMMTGSAAHYSILKAIGRVIPGREETAFTLEDEDISGRIDLLFTNPKTREKQVIEFKFVSDFAFKQVKRDNLPDYLRSTKNIYPPRPEHRKQVLLYIFAKRKEGMSVACGNIIYVNRNSGEMKEALVLWDALAEEDTLKLVEKIREAKRRIDQGQLPEPSVESAYVCEKLCPHRLNCDCGHDLAARGVRREQHKKSRVIYQAAKEQRQRKTEEMVKLGLVQSGLPGLSGEEAEKFPTGGKNKDLPIKKETPACGDCGQPMVWNKKAARGGKYVCLHCSSD